MWHWDEERICPYYDVMSSRIELSGGGQVLRFLNSTEAIQDDRENKVCAGTDRLVQKACLESGSGTLWEVMIWDVTCEQTCSTRKAICLCLWWLIKPSVVNIYPTSVKLRF